MKRRNLLISCFITMAAPLMAQQLPYQNTGLTPEERAADLCSRLTLDEKAQIMCDESPAIPRLGIPQFQWWSEALHGAARNGFATVFPITMGMAASWDDALLYKVYDAVSDEARAKNQLAKLSGKINRYQGLSFWTPNINIFRDPRWGRGQETYGEDPYLTSRMGLAVVRGLQGPAGSKYMKLLACAKHFAVHSGPEWNRHQFDVENLPARDLWETYLPAFKALVEEGKVAEVMCAYQRLAGDPCCGNNRLLQQILRDEWKFKGMVVSDCGAISDFWQKGCHEVSADNKSASAKAVRSGTDVECGGNYLSLPEAVKAGQITQAQIDVSVKRLLKARFELGEFDPDEMVQWTKIPASVIASREHKQLALDMARETMTLLQNRSSILPLAKNGLKIAVMGPNANDSTMQWGNYNGYPTNTVTILQGIKAKTKNVRYVTGCGLTRNEVTESHFGEISTTAGNPGMTATYWNNENMTGTPVTETDMHEPINLSNGGATVFAPGVALEHFSACYEGTLRPASSGPLLFSIAADDKARVIVNGDTLINKWKSHERIQQTQKEIDVKAGEAYHIKVDYVQATAMAALKFDIVRKQNASTADIISKVGDADVVVFVGGISPRLEGEEMRVTEPGFKGGDRTDIELPQAQRDVIAALHQAGKRVVLVNCSGGAMGLVPESENADAILQAWYPGEQGGTAVADALFGDCNPSGKLPVTFYKSVDQLPDFLDYRMTGRTYRYFKGTPLFPFGYGLSYTTFAYGKPSYKNNKVIVNITNTGKMAGTEIVQVYIRNLADVNGPIKTLRAFKRVQLNAGGTKTVEIDFPRKNFEGWDVKTNTMRVVPGYYKITIGDKEMKVRM